MPQGSPCGPYRWEWLGDRGLTEESRKLRIKARTALERGTVGEIQARAS